MYHNELLHKSFKLSSFEHDNSNLFTVLASNFEAGFWNKDDETMSYKAPYKIEVTAAGDYFTQTNPNHIFFKNEFPEAKYQNHVRVNTDSFDDFDAEEYADNFTKFIINYVKFTKMPVKIDYYKPDELYNSQSRLRSFLALKFTVNEVTEKQSEAEKQLKETTLAFVKYGQQHHEDFVKARQQALKFVSA